VAIRKKLIVEYLRKLNASRWCRGSSAVPYFIGLDEGKVLAEQKTHGKGAHTKVKHSRGKRGRSRQ